MPASPSNPLATLLESRPLSPRLVGRSQNTAVCRETPLAKRYRWYRRYSKGKS